MRRLLCENCLTKYLPEGKREIFPRSDFEPAEFQRLTVGIARKPSPQQRFISVNNEHFPLAVSHYNCDHCDIDITPGQRCAAFTVWREDQEEIGLWESEYLEAA